MIVAKFNNSSSTEKCAVLDKEFYHKEGLGFFLSGDLKRPVSPEAALKLGFTMDEELLDFLSAELRHLKHVNINDLFDD